MPDHRAKKSIGRVKRRSRNGPEEVPSIDLDEFLPYLFHLVASRLNHRFLERLRPHGVTVQRWRVLMAVRNLGPRNIGELGKLTLIPQSALSRVVDQMERDRLVLRQISEIDNRVVEVHLTAHGRLLYGKLVPAAMAHAEALVDEFSVSEREMLFMLLRRILKTLQTEALPGAEDGALPHQDAAER